MKCIRPSLTAMINASIREGYLPATQKHAIGLTPLLKKPYFDASDLMKNYRTLRPQDTSAPILSRIIGRALSRRNLEVFRLFLVPKCLWPKCPVTDQNGPVSNLAFISKVVERIVHQRSSCSSPTSRSTTCYRGCSRCIGAITRRRLRFCVFCPTSTPPPTVKTSRCSVF